MPEVFITGSAGRIEGKYHKSEDPKAPVALVLHPHPCDGTMNNKITYNLYKNFVNNGFSYCALIFVELAEACKFDNGIGDYKILRQ